MRRSIIATVIVAVLSFTVSGVASYLIALKPMSRSRWATQFAPLASADAKRIQEIGRCSYDLEMSRSTTQPTPTSLLAHLQKLQDLRRRSPAELWPVIDLETATDHAALNRVYAQAHDLAAMSNESVQAQALVRSLGWKDVSQDSLNALADTLLKWKGHK